jgi:hypothetical protein
VVAARENDEPGPVGELLVNLSDTLDRCRRFERTKTVLLEAQDSFRSVGEPYILTEGMGELSTAELGLGNLAEAHRLAEDSLALARHGPPWHVASCTSKLAAVAQAEGDPEWASLLWSDSIQRFQAIGERRHIPRGLEGLAHAAALTGDPERAATLLGAAAAIREQTGVPLPPVEQPAYDATLERVRSALTPTELAARWDTGSAMLLAAAVDFAIAGVER